MKKHTTKKTAKLNLKKETLRKLQAKDLKDVAGGGYTWTCPVPGGSSGTNYCQTAQ